MKTETITINHFKKPPQQKYEYEISPGVWIEASDKKLRVLIDNGYPIRLKK